MAVQQARVPVLGSDGRFPDAYAPPSVAANTAAAQEAREGAETARTGAVTAQGKAEDAQRGAEDALAGVPGAVDGALAQQVQAAQTAANDAGTARNQAQEFAGQAQTSASSAAGSAATATTAAATATSAASTAGASQTSATASATAAASSATAALGAREDAIQAAVSATTAAATALPEWDSVAGEYKAASLAAWISRQRDGKIYGVQIPKGSAVACTKTGANAGIPVPTPGVIGTPAADAYMGRGPFFTATVNGFVTADGVPHVTAFQGDPTFSLTGSADVWVLAPVLYWRLDTTPADYVELSVTDVARPGFSPQPKAILPAGGMRPYMLYAKYAMSIVGGVARSVSGRPIANRNVSHNSLITQCKTASTGYAGKSFADDWYVKSMFLLKYATKNSQSVFAGVTNWDVSAPIAVAESGTTRVIIATSTASNIPVGSALMLGSNAAKQDRGAGTAFDIFDGLRVVKKEPYDGSNTAIYLNAATAFNTTVGTFVQSAPWNTGACDAVVGDGSPTNRTNGCEPFTVQGIELGLGMNEIVGDVILKSDGATGWQIYTNPDSKNEATAISENYQATGKYNPSGPSDGNMYPMYPDSAGGMLFGTGSGASTSTGLADIIYYNGTAVTGEREWRTLGNLWVGGSAGLWCVSGSNGLAYADWSFGSRLSAVGRSK